MARWGRIVVAVAAVVVVGAGAALAWGQYARHRLAAAHPAPGTLVEVDGRTAHLNCAGSGSPTVVLEAANADFSIVWSRVQPDVATFTRVCSYDRAGLGWSAPAGVERTVANMTTELHALLAAGGIEPPYVIAAHSFGGIVARVFAAQYPGTVAGVVLVDSSHPDQMTRVPQLAAVVDSTVAQFRGLAWMTSTGLLAAMPDAIPAGHFDGSAAEDYRAVLATGGFFDAAADEFAALATNVAAARGTTLGDLPVVVISRGMPDLLPGMSHADSAAIESAWAEMQTELVALSPNSRQVIAGASGHYVQLDEPGLVIEAIRSVVERVRMTP